MKETTKRRNPGWYAVTAFLLAVLTGLLLGSCSLGNSCTVVMTETGAAADPVKPSKEGEIEVLPVLPERQLVRNGGLIVGQKQLSCLLQHMIVVGS